MVNIDKKFFVNLAVSVLFLVCILLMIGPFLSPKTPKEQCEAEADIMKYDKSYCKDSEDKLTDEEKKEIKLTGFNLAFGKKNEYGFEICIPFAGGILTLLIFIAAIICSVIKIFVENKRFGLTIAIIILGVIGGIFCFIAKTGFWFQKVNYTTEAIKNALKIYYKLGACAIVGGILSIIGAAGAGVEQWVLK